MLHTPASMETKSAKAFRSMLFIAEDNGNHLHVRCQLYLCEPLEPERLLVQCEDECCQQFVARAFVAMCINVLCAALAFTCTCWMPSP